MAGLNRILAEKYTNLQSEVVENSALNTAREKVFNLFQRKASTGTVTDKTGTEYDAAMVKGGLDACGDFNAIEDFANFLGLASTPIAVEEDAGPRPDGKHISPEEVLRIINSGAANGVVIQSHYSNIELPVTEIWVQDGIIKVAVELPDGS